MKRFGAALLAGVLGVGLLTGCEADDSAERDLTIDDLDSALLVDGDLGAEFTTIATEARGSNAGAAPSGGPDWGCLNDFREDLIEASSGKPPPHASVAIKADPKPNTPSITEEIVLADDDEAAQRALATIADLAGRCHSVDAVDQGLHVKFRVTSDRVAWAAGSDQQVNVVATGTSDSGESQLPLTIAFSFVRIADVRIMVTFMDLAADIGSAHREVVDAAVARVRAALDSGDQPAPADVLADYPIGEGFRQALAREKDAVRNG